MSLDELHNSGEMLDITPAVGSRSGTNGIEKLHQRETDASFAYQKYLETKEQTRLQCTQIEKLPSIGETFNIVSPGGNTTLILEGGQFNQQNIADIAKRIIGWGGIEQVGILTQPPPDSAAHLHMMGGEFCLNGVRAAAALLHFRETQMAPLRVFCSGRRQPVECHCDDLEHEQGKLRVNAILGVLPRFVPCDEETILVELEGISHFLCPTTEQGLEYKGVPDLKAILKKYGDKVLNSPAVGGIFYAEGERGMRIKPIVYVRATNTYVEESGCASACAALAMSHHCNHMTHQRMHIEQPSGDRYVVAVKMGENITDDHIPFKVSVASPVIVQRDHKNLGRPDHSGSGSR